MDRSYVILIGLVTLAILGTIYTDYRSTNAISIQEITIESSSRSLAALYAQPDMSLAVNSTPGVVVYHGFSASKEMMRPFVEGLARSGFAVLAIDQQGHGLSDGTLGVPENGLEIDGIAAVKYMQSRPEVDTNRIGLVGHSMGAGVVLDVALALDSAIKSNVVIGNSLSGIKETDANQSKPSNLLMAIGQYDELFDIDTAIETCSYLVGQDIKEGILYGSFENGDARKLLISPTDHIFEVINPVIVEETHKWLQKTLVSRFGVSPVVKYSKPEGQRFVFDQLFSAISGIFWISLIPAFINLRKSRYPWDRGEIRWVSHGAISVLGFILGSLIILISANFVGLFLGWMIVAGVFFFFRNKSQDESIIETFRRQFRIDHQELLLTSLFVLSVFLVVQLILNFIHWDFRYVLPMLLAMSFRRTPQFLLLFIVGSFFFTVEITHMKGTEKSRLVDILKEMAGRTWPYLAILMIQYFPLFLVGEAVAPGIIGFLAFFLVGLIPVMYVITAIATVARNNGYLPTSISVVASFMVAWLLAGTVPFVT